MTSLYIARPNVITQSHTLLIDRASGTLKDRLMEELDHNLLPEPAWLKMHAWFGLSAGSQPIPRCEASYYCRTILHYGC